MESEYAKTAAAISLDSATHRENPNPTSTLPEQREVGRSRSRPSNVIFSTGYLVTLKKQQFVDLTSKGLMSSNQ